MAGAYWSTNCAHYPKNRIYPVKLCSVDNLLSWTSAINMERGWSPSSKELHRTTPALKDSCYFEHKIFVLMVSVITGVDCTLHALIIYAGIDTERYSCTVVVMHTTLKIAVILTWLAYMYSMLTDPTGFAALIPAEKERGVEQSGNKAIRTSFASADGNKLHTWSSASTISFCRWKINIKWILK